jgi:hypothetical protein
MSNATTFSTKQPRLPIALHDQRRIRDPLPEKLVACLRRGGR